MYSCRNTTLWIKSASEKHNLKYKYTLNTNYEIMKNLFTFLFIAFTIINANSTIVYTDIADATLTSGGSIDINFDGTGAAEITFDDMGFDAVEPGVMFKSADEHLTTVSTAEWDVIKGYPVNTNIDASTGWYDMGDAYVDPGWGTTKFPSTGDAYIGASFKIGANVHYGWIRVNWDANGTFIVKDYAYENAANTAIAAGNTGNVGVNNGEENSVVSIFPNPTTNYLNINSINKVSLVNIYTVDGRIVHTESIKGKDNKISVINLPNGFYTMQVIFENGELNVSTFLKN